MSNMVVQTNVLALNSHRNMKGIGVQQSRASSRLSSGFKINSAADDAAGLAISEKMRSQIRGLDMASKNAQDASSLIQTAEGGMQEIDNMVQRIRELVVYAANDTQDQGSQSDGSVKTVQGDRQKVQDEISSLMKEIDSMANRVEFNKKKLINGDFSGKEATTVKTEATALSDALVTANNIKADTNADKTAASNALSAAASNTLSAATSATTATANVQFSDLADAVDFLSDATALSTSDAYAHVSDALDKAVDLLRAINTKNPVNYAAEKQTIVDMFTKELDVAKTLGGNAKELGDVAKAFADWASDGLKDVERMAGKQVTAQGNLATAQTKDQTAAANVTLASNTLSDFGAAHTSVSAALSDTTELTKAGDKIYFQVGANANQGWSLSISEITCKGLGLSIGKITEDGVKEGASPTGGNIDPNSLIDVMKATGEGDVTGLLDRIDNAMTIVTTERSKLGAAQNRLEYTMKSLDTTSENLSASESRIRDTDMAKEMMNLTKANVLNQAAISMLSQANQAPQSVLQLLQ